MFENLNLSTLGSYLPSVQKPTGKLTLREKLKWTGIILVLFFALGQISVWGIDSSAVARFEFLEIVFGSRFGSLITLGIGPIVTASIILQLLVGSKILSWDTKTKEGKEKFTATQKILAIFFCFFEAIAYVMAGAVPPSAPALAGIVILQLAAGGILIMFMDEVVSKWGIGSGVSLFIAAGVAKSIFVRIFAPPIAGQGGGIIASVIGALSLGQPAQALIAFFPLLATITVFVIVTYAQSMKVEIPMAFTMPYGKFGSRRWPIKFIYTSNIPVILAAAVLANLQVIGGILASRGINILGVYDLATNQPTGGLMYFLTIPQNGSLMIMAVFGGLLTLAFALAAKKFFGKFILRSAAAGMILGMLIGYGFTLFLNLQFIDPIIIARALTYAIFMTTASVVFSIFWVSTAGMDAKTVAEQFQSSFIQIPGFRRDPRIVESVLERYIPSLTVLGGAFVGALASFADLTSALGTGTGILLSVMIVYQMYEQLVNQHYDELPEFVKKIIG